MMSAPCTVGWLAWRIGPCGPSIHSAKGVSAGGAVFVCGAAAGCCAARASCRIRRSIGKFGSEMQANRPQDFHQGVESVTDEGCILGIQAGRSPARIAFNVDVPKLDDRRSIQNLITSHPESRRS